MKKILLSGLMVALVLLLGFFAGAYYQSEKKTHSAANLAVVAMQDETAQWSQFIGSLHRAGSLVDEYTKNLSELDKLEGYRLVTRMTGLGLDRMLETANPAAPQFLRLQSHVRKFAGDAPDQLYHSANVSADNSYRITGNLSNKRASPVLMEVSVYGGNMSFEGESSRRLVSHLDEAEIITDKDGNFEIYLGKTRQGENWLELADDVKSVLVRRYYRKPQLNDLEPLKIQLVDAEADVAPLTRAQLIKGLLGAAAFAEEATRFWHNWVNNVRKQSAVNTMREMQDNGDLLTPAGIKYTEGYWQVAPNQALEITFTPPADIPYWSFVPMNMWMESFDWHLATVTSNNFMAEPNEDGSVTLVMSEQNPGVKNWVYVQGHQRGLMSLRFARMGDHAVPEVTTELITLTQ